jgi:hypothetical protein
VQQGSKTIPATEPDPAGAKGEIEDGYETF